MTFFGRAPIGVLLSLEKLASTMITSPDSPRDPSNQRFFLQRYLHLFRRTCVSVQPYYLRDVKHLDLDGWIDLCSLREASDQRDLVFGFWGWLPPQIREKARVDYSRPAEEVLDACKRAFLATAARLEFLSLSNFYSRQNPRGLPSWDPELFYFRRGRCQGGDLWVETIPSLHSLDQSLGQTERAHQEILDGLKVLRIRGRWVGNVIQPRGDPTG